MFLPYKSDTGTLQPWEYMPAAAGTYQAGQLLAVTAGKLSALADASKTTPPYLCMADVTAADGQIVPVQRVTSGVIFVTQLGCGVEGSVVGTKMQVSSGGMSVDSFSAGTFEILWQEGTADESAVLGRFV